MAPFLGAPAAEYAKVWKIPQRFAKMAFTRRVVEDQMAHNKLVSGAEMPKTLTWFSFACIGVGSMIATGIFSFMPLIYAEYTGPSVVISLIVASVVAAVSALMYAEFAVEYPVVGGGFVYVLNVFGEFPAILCGVNLVIDYIFGNASVLRTLSDYLAQLFNIKATHFRINVSFQNDDIDWMALLIAGVLTIICLLSTKVFDEGNSLLQYAHVGLVIFTFCVAFTKADTSNWTPFFPTDVKKENGDLLFQNGLGARTIITGSANIFFVFVGYDAIALGAEEAKNDSAVPVGMMACVIVVSVLYLLMASSLIMLITPAQFQMLDDRTFSAALKYRGLNWAKYIVAAGATIGIVTSAGVGIFALSRILQVFAREGMILPIFGYVWERTGTPVLGVIVAGVGTGLMACLISVDHLVNMTSIGVLTMYWFVAVAYIYRRYCPEFEDASAIGAGKDRVLNVPFRPDPFKRASVGFKRLLLMFYIFMICASSIGFTIYWNLEDTKKLWLILCTVVWFVTTAAMWLTLPIEYVPEKFSLPAWSLPWLPSVSIYSCIILVGGFGAGFKDYERLFIAMAGGAFLYLIYGVTTTYYRFYGSSSNWKGKTTVYV